VTDPTPTNSNEEPKAWRKQIYVGLPLTSRAKWLTIKVLYILFCIAGVVGVLKFTDGTAKAIGLTVMAFFVGGLIELFALRYDKYRAEWEMANSGEEPEGEASQPTP
jgi:hypothetical protein